MGPSVEVKVMLPLIMSSMYLVRKILVFKVKLRLGACHRLKGWKGKLHIISK